MSIDPEKLYDAINMIPSEWLADRVAGNRAFALVVEAARAHLATLPRYKEVEVWECRWVSRSAGGDFMHTNVYRSFTEAHAHGAFLNAGGNNSDATMHCVEVVGPRKQRVPA